MHLAGYSRDARAQWVLIPQDEGAGNKSWGLTGDCRDSLVGIDIRSEYTRRSMCTGSSQPQAHVQTYSLVCTTYTCHHTEPQTWTRVCKLSPDAQRDPGSHAPVDTVTRMNETQVILHTWAPIQITVSTRTGIGIGITPTPRHCRDGWTCLESGIYTVVVVSGTDTYLQKETHIHSAVAHVDRHMHTISRSSRCLSRPRQMESQLCRLTHVQSLMNNCKLT